MTILGPRPVRENVVEPFDPLPRRRRFIPRSRRGKAAVAAAMTGVLVAFWAPRTRPHPAEPCGESRGRCFPGTLKRSP